MRGFGVTSVSFAVETHMNRVAKVLDVDPFELRMRNAQRIGDTTPNRVALHDPSTIPVIQAVAEAAGIELAGHLRSMTNASRSGELLPEHLVAQQALGKEQ
jgi:CO/xanthine dehydrogenase Mo-binding subunit